MLGSVTLMTRALPARVTMAARAPPVPASSHLRVRVPVALLAPTARRPWTRVARRLVPMAAHACHPWALVCVPRAATAISASLTLTIVPRRRASTAVRVWTAPLRLRARAMLV